MKRVFVLTLVVAGLFAGTGSISVHRNSTAVGNQDGSYLKPVVRVLADGEPPPPPKPMPPMQNNYQKTPWLTADGEPPPPVPWFRAV